MSNIIPTAIKIAMGNPGKRPLNKNEPQPAKTIPPCPPGLSAESSAAWGRLSVLLHNLGVLTELDAMALERLCDCYAEILSCRRLIKKNGRTYKTIGTTGSVVIKANPAVGQLSDADRRFKGYLVEFGMTPAARTKVRVEGEKEKDPLDEFFN